MPTYSVFAGAINKAVKGTLHFSHMYPNGELKAFEEHLLIKCYNRFARRSDSEYTRLSKEDRGGGVQWPGAFRLLLKPMVLKAASFPPSSFSAWGQGPEHRPILSPDRCPLSSLHHWLAQGQARLQFKWGRKAVTLQPYINKSLLPSPYLAGVAHEWLNTVTSCILCLKTWLKSWVMSSLHIDPFNPVLHMSCLSLRAPRS